MWVFANDHSLNIDIVYLESLPEGFHISYPHIEEGYKVHFDKILLHKNI